MDWAVRECRAAALRDARLVRRLAFLLARFAQCWESLPHALHECSALKAAYRFLDNDRVTPKAILEGHRRATLDRAKEDNILLVAEDTTSLNYSSHHAMEGLGPIERSSARGLFLHSGLGISPHGVPLGLIAQKMWVRKDKGEEAHDSKKKHLLEGKESQRWADMADEAARMLQPATRMVLVADRESDDYEVFHRARENRYDFLIRCQFGKKRANRRLQSGKPLWQAVERAPRLGTVTVHIEHSGSKKSRSATLTLQATPITLQPPYWREKEFLPCIEMYVIRAYEEAPPDGVTPLEWLLVTSLPVTNLEQAAQCARWYSYRWLIERFHHILKSGCRTEQLQLESAEQIMRAITVYSIVAWRVLWLTYQARQTPEVPCTQVLTDSEWHVLYAKMKNTTVMPEHPPTLRTAVRWIAQLGGFLARKGDGEPGVKTLWRGLRRFDNMVADWELFTRLYFT